MLLELLILYLFIAYVASFAFCELGYPRISWFFIATFWLSVGYLLAVFEAEWIPKILVIIVFCLTMVLVGGRQEQERR